MKTEALHHYIKRYISLDQSELEVFDQNLSEKHFHKKEFLVEAGNVCKYRYFLLEGLTRSYYINSNGTEKITQFGKEHWWVTDLESFTNQSPSRVNIQALEDTTALAISFDNLEGLFHQLPKVERLFRIITERWLIAQQRNSHFYMQATSKERYEGMVRSIPNFMQRVPQYMIASYLEITPEHLSKLRKSRD